MLKFNVNLDNKTVLLTGACGFIGSYIQKRLFETFKNIQVIGIDNMNTYYDVKLKEARLKELKRQENFKFIKGNIADKKMMMQVFDTYHPEVVIHLAAQAGVRYSITNPEAYLESNIIGFFNILEGCRYYPVEHLVYASSSSVYGANRKIPYSVGDKVDTPVSFYAATKKSDELMAYAYAKLYGIPATGLRFFTVYGPAGRPDMAYFGFTDKLLRGETIEIYNYGNCQRDFTYIDDIVTGMVCVLQKSPDRDENGVPYKIYNIGNNKPENLLYFVDVLQQELVGAGVLPETYDFESHRKLLPMQRGDVQITYANVDALEEDFGFRPNTKLRDGIRKFARWYKAYYMGERQKDED